MCNASKGAMKRSQYISPQSTSPLNQSKYLSKEHGGEEGYTTN